ncbi:MAG: hypothetical protein ACLTMP_00660 [Eggerthella lenta]
MPSLSVQPLVRTPSSRRFPAGWRGVVKVSSWREGRSFGARPTTAWIRRALDRCSRRRRRRRTRQSAAGRSARAQPCRTGERHDASPRCGGTMRVENEAGGGASVTMTVPCKEEEVRDDQAHRGG